PPGKVAELKVTDSSYTTLSLSWTKPVKEEGVQDEAKGYFVELRPAENPEWGRCNTNPIVMTTFTIVGLKSMAMYWVRVIGTNEGGDGTVTISWTPSPDEKRDNRLHYMVTKQDSVKLTWNTVADNLFNNRFTAVNIMPGRQYKFRIYAKNDMGLSAASESPIWEVKKKKGKF
ncbi:hypothetical protein GOODEAATRI_026904, partial [Goodea atripinnis]